MTLLERNAEIVELYKSGYTAAEIGEVYDLTKQGVSLITNAAGNDLAEESRAARRDRLRTEGWITQNDKLNLATEYRHDLRMFHEDQMVRLYLAGMSMAEISQLLRGKYAVTWVQDVLKTEGVDRRIPGQYERTTAWIRYPWEVWTRAGWHEVEQGREFDCKPACLRQRIYARARQDGRKATVYIDGKIVRFCFFVPGLQKRPLHESPCRK